MRREDWHARLIAALDWHRTAEPAWGRSDCWIAACEAFAAITGDTLLPELRGYRTEAGGYRLFARHGFDTVEAAIAAVLDRRPFHAVRRGDLAIIEGGNGPSCGVVVAGGIAVKRITGDDPVRGRMMLVPIAPAMRFYAVE